MAKRTYTPPKSVQRAAANGLKLREEYGRGGTSTGIARARDLSGGKNIPLDTIRRMKAFFDRHEGNKDTPPKEGNGKIAWQLWGGDAGRTWAEGIIAREDKQTEKRVYAEVEKVDDELGLVLGFTIVCEENGEPYFDLQGDHIPEESMLKAATDFMQHSRTAKEMHAGEAAGSVVFAWPLTKDIADAMGLTVTKTGLMIAMKPGDDEMLEKFRSGEYTGFSIGGVRLEDEDVEED